MAMSDREIHLAINSEDFRITPKPSRINPAGIDLTSEGRVVIPPGKQRLGSTTERVELSNRVLGVLHIRSSFAREGLIASLALVDPGFKGQLTVSLYNAGESQVIIDESERFVQLTLFKLGRSSKKIYSGRYQNSKGVVKSKRRK